MPIQFYWGSGGEKPPTRMTCTKCINQYITGFASSYPHERNNCACRSTSSKSPQLYPIWVCLKIGNPGLLPNPAVYHNFSSMAINWGPTRPPYILSHTKMILSEIYYTKQNGANHILPTLSQKRSIDIPILGQFFFFHFRVFTHHPSALHDRGGCGALRSWESWVWAKPPVPTAFRWPSGPLPRALSPTRWGLNQDVHKL